jgi:ABC-2 type transport system permease protein
MSSASEIRNPKSQIRNVLWLAVWSLASREIIRFARQRTRVIGALGQPVLFWILFGAGLRGSFNPPAWAPADMTYQQYFFPGVAVLIVLFTAIFSTISIIEDRREGFLQGVLVAPISRLAIVLGKLSGGAALAVVQAGLFLALAPFVGLSISLTTGLEVLAFLTLLAFAMTALGFLIAWPLDSTQGFHAIMSVFLLPMWILSGAFFPAGESVWLSWVIRANPLTYGVAGLRRLLYSGGELRAAAGLPAMSVCIAVTILFCLVCIAISVWLANRRTSHDTR